MSQLPKRVLPVAGLVPLAALAFALLAASPVRAASDVCYSGGPTLANFRLNGSASLDGSSIVITKAIGNESGSVMYQTPLSAASDFHVKMKVRITTPPSSSVPADGMTFVMHNAPSGAAATGGVGDGIGYAGITPSVVVEFDTYYNNYFGDPAAPHIAITRSGVPNHASLTNLGLPAPVLFSALSPPVDPVNGTPFFIWIDYAALTTRLDVFVSASDTKPAAAALGTTTIDLGAIFAGGFYIGFTSSTGGAWSKHEFLELYASDSGATANAGCCATNNDCVGSPAGAICDPNKRVCGACTLANTATCPLGSGSCNLAVSHNVCAVPCDGNFGGATPAACSSAAYPACRTTGAGAGSCGACTGDAGTAGAAACAPGAPFCTATGYCGLCTTNADCTSAGATHAGMFCNSTTGVCVATCAVDLDCGPGNSCLGTACVAKAPNGAPIPGGACAPLLSARYCISNVCSTANNTCGFVNGTGTCDGASAAAVCQSATCSTAGVCIPASSGACYADADCTAGFFCERNNLMCKAKLAAGVAVSNDGLHDGTCSVANAAAVCTSGLCNSTTNTCAAANGADCTMAAECRGNLCGSNAKCGAANGQAGCTSGNVADFCQSGACNSTGVCVPPVTGSCFIDADCDVAFFCRRDTFTCAAKLAAGTPLPSDGLHDGNCTVPSATALCTSGLCNATTRTCGAAPGTACTAAAGCANNICAANSQCGHPIGAGPCGAANAAVVCQTGACGATSNICVPAGASGCGADDDCLPDAFCNRTLFHCADKLTSGTPLPADGVHATCTAGNNAACASALCNADTGTCADANGIGCTTAAQCVQNACGRSGTCGLDDGQAGCTAATAAICQTGVCAGSGVCGAAGCAVDVDCPDTAYCNGATGLCKAKLAIGQVIPSDGLHDGTCTTGTAIAVCESGACNAATNACALPTGAACTADTTCRTGTCGANDKCGFADGEGPCSSETQAITCQSGLCNAGSQQCQPTGEGRCTRDDDCADGTYCNRTTFSCVVKLGIGSALPIDGLHDGTCSAANASAVCVSGLCNSQSNVCAAPNDAACTAASGCVSNVCFSDGRCALPEGILCDLSTDCRSGTCTEGVCGSGRAPRSIGGSGGCSAAGSMSGNAAPGLLGLAFIALALALTLAGKRRRRG